MSNPLFIDTASKITNDTQPSDLPSPSRAERPLPSINHEIDEMGIRHKVVDGVRQPITVDEAVNQRREFLQDRLGEITRQRDTLAGKINEVTGYKADGTPIFAYDDERRGKFKLEMDGLERTVVFQREIYERDLEAFRKQVEERFAAPQRERERQEALRKRAEEVRFEQEAREIAANMPSRT